MKFEAPGFREMIERGKLIKRVMGREVTMDDAPKGYGPSERYAWASGFHDAILTLQAAGKIKRS